MLSTVESSNGNCTENWSLITDRTWFQLICTPPQDCNVLISEYRGMEVLYGDSAGINLELME